jgi:hypothetical protein
MSSFGDILSVYRDFVLWGLATGISVILLVRYWDRVALFATNVKYGLPMVGKLARLARVHRAPSEGSDWYQSEKTLCNDYKRFVKVADLRQFLECKTYLKKAGDSGRSPLPVGIWFLIIALVFVEAMGFSYVLAGWTVPGASPDQQVYASYGLAFIISVILVALTHFSGHELHRTSAIRHALKERSHDRSASGPITSPCPDLDQSLNDVTKPQSLDDDKPAYTQFANRVGVNPSYVVSIITVVAIVGIAFFATYVRNKTFEKQQTEESAGIGGEYYGNVPPELQATQSAADTKAADEAKGLAKQASTMTFILLAIIFVFLQILGILFGIKWGFAGRESKKAYKRSGGKRFDTFDDYRSYSLDRVVDTAQSKLESLRQRMVAQSERRGYPLPTFTRKGFLDFVHELRRNALAAEAYEAVRPAPAPAGAPAPAAAPPAAPKAALPPVPQKLPPVPGRPLPPVPNAKKYFYTDVNDRPSAKPVTLSELEQLFRAGGITLNTWTLEEGSDNWVAFKELSEQAGSSA